jgi:hypothetical protein
MYVTVGVAHTAVHDNLERDGWLMPPDAGQPTRSKTAARP